MSEKFNDYTISIMVENSEETLPRKSLVFTKRDSIFSLFPHLEFIYPDLSGIALEYGTFLQGLNLKTVLGVDGDLLQTNWKITSRDTIKQGGSSPLLSGVLKVEAVHEAFFSDRTLKPKAWKKSLVSDCFEELFPDVEKLVEPTAGKIDLFSISEPFEVASMLKEIATSGTVSPFVFFVDLNGVYVFSSIQNLLNQSTVATFELKPVFSDSESVETNIQGFLPFSETAKSVFPKMRVHQKFLNKDLTYETLTTSISDSEPDTIPLIAENPETLYNWTSLGRQFNPDVDYATINNALATNSMNFILDKAVCIVPFNYKCVAGKTVEIQVKVLDFEGTEQLSEYYSGKWLIEQSFHTWDGTSLRPSTKLILCRTGVKPVKDSILGEKAYK